MNHINEYNAWSCCGFNFIRHLIFLSFHWDNLFNIKCIIIVKHQVIKWIILVASSAQSFRIFHIFFLGIHIFMYFSYESVLIIVWQWPWFLWHFNLNNIIAILFHRPVCGDKVVRITLHITAHNFLYLHEIKKKKNIKKTTSGSYGFETSA